MVNLIGLRELRQNMDHYAKKAAAGESFVVLKHSKPVFKISPVSEDLWEEVVDFTKIKKGGIDIDELTSRL